MINKYEVKWGGIYVLIIWIIDKGKCMMVWKIIRLWFYYLGNYFI